MLADPNVIAASPDNHGTYTLSSPEVAIEASRCIVIALYSPCIRLVELAPSDLGLLDRDIGTALVACASKNRGPWCKFRPKISFSLYVEY